MENDKIYENIINGKAILITGSGAHLDVEDPNGNVFPSGARLANKLYGAIGIKNPENPWDLQDASESFLERKSASELIEEIKIALTVGKVTETAKILYSSPWKRVYTTNYDNVPRVSTSHQNNPLLPRTLGDFYDATLLEKRICLYINGYIENLTPETLNSEFKLTGKSYMTADYLDNSQWGALFAEDIETASCIVIVGVSLEYDLDIKRFIYNREVQNKIVFVESEGISEDKLRKLKRMGDVKPIGAERFTRELETYLSTHKPNNTDFLSLYSFEEYFVKRNLFNKLTSVDIYRFLVTGDYIGKENLWFRRKGKYVNIIYRRKLQEVIKNLLDGIKVIYIHANLGNGKTIFIESLKNQLQNQNYRIFTLNKDHLSNVSSEIEEIISLKGKKIVIIENYYNYVHIIKKFGIYNLTDVQFIFSARSVLVDIRIAEVKEILSLEDGDSIMVDINKLNREEEDSLRRLFDRNGLWGKYASYSINEKRKLLSKRDHGNRELQSILVEVIDSAYIKKEFKRTIENIKQLKSEYYEVLILALVVKTMSLDLSGTDISRILNYNMALDPDFYSNVDVREIIDFESGKTEFKLKSAVTTRMILKELDCDNMIIQVLGKTAHWANRYFNTERYENVLKNIISYSHVKTFLESDSRGDFLIRYYDALKELSYYRENSFFWLQYSIACMNIGKYDLAQTYLDSAQSYFRSSSTVVPFQLDTHQARLYLTIIRENECDNVKETFMEAHRLLMQPIVSDKDDPVKQISTFSFYTKNQVKRNLFSKGLRDIHRKACEEAYNKIKDLEKKHSFNSRNNFKNLSYALLRNSLEK